MKTYVINLDECVVRRKYMEKQLMQFPFLSSEFVQAVDGRRMDVGEQFSLFDVEGFTKRYLRKIRPGEVGCVLSHQKCYRKLVESNDRYALILEDDVILNQAMQSVIEKCAALLKADTPHIILLSGWYWYWKSGPLQEEYRIADVFDAFLTHAYLINVPAARLLLQERPCIVADDWKYIRKQGVKLQAVLPHLIETDDSGAYPTTISNIPMQLQYDNSVSKLKRFVYAQVLRIFKLLGHFEKHNK